VWDDVQRSDVVVARLSIWVANVAADETAGMALCLSLALRRKLDLHQFTSLIDQVGAITGWKMRCCNKDDHLLLSRLPDVSGR